MIAMKKILIFMVTITFLALILVLIINPPQVVNYLSVKNEYIKNHPGQVIIPYPWEPTTSIRVLPFNYEIPAAPANNILITACRDQFESASFIITALKDISGMNITHTALSDGQGHSIPASAIDIRTVKVWYQAHPDNVNLWDGGIHYGVLTPELLLKNDSIVKVDYTTQQNFVWIYNTTYPGGTYIHLDNTSLLQFPEDGRIYDNATSSGDIQPFSLLQNENKQIWITTHVPGNTVPGNYSGTITISSPLTSPVVMNFGVRVLPFTLVNATKEYGLYYVGHMTAGDPIRYPSSDWKTASQMLIELQDMYNHGIRYPTYGNENNSRLDEAFTMRDTVGFPKDKIYIVPGGGWETTWSSYIGNPTDEAGLADVAYKVKMWRNHTETYGYTTTYFYGIDEATGSNLTSQRDAWNTIHANGGKIMASSYKPVGDLHSNMGDTLDAANLGYPLNSHEAELWHIDGHKVFLYNQPQVGVENPEIYRENYGYRLWISGYDGTMNMGYQSSCGDIWNDFDCAEYRDHVFAYPKTEGIIPTIEWEGWREGVDDTRYADTLTLLQGSDTASLAIITDSLFKGEDMAKIRNKVIEHILRSSP